MADKRQTFRVILQLMTYIGVAVLLWVMFSSAFVADNAQQEEQDVNIEISLHQLAVGELTHVLWQGQRVSILHRNDAQQTPYFVFYDLGDSGNCPLFFNGKLFKDTCTGTQYNQLGKPITQNRAGSLESPPHHFLLKQNKLVIGVWK
ncbi:MAG: hypothetical protein KAG20_10110 [Cocleimonas sp.]|nr:hypothetical protein [Cocleimonas sp.]